MTLIELIFAVVIIAVVFMVVPRLMSVSSRSMQTSIKEEALFDAVSLIHLISSLPWDQETIDSEGKILDADGVECNATTGYRIGGFIGSRNCIGGPYSVDDAVNDCDDIDDYNVSACYEGESNTSGGLMPYHLNVVVNRDEDNKSIVVEVNTTPESAGRLGVFSASFFYHSYNLGWVQINRRAW